MKFTLHSVSQNGTLDSMSAPRGSFPMAPARRQGLDFILKHSAAFARWTKAQRVG